MSKHVSAAVCHIPADSAATRNLCRWQEDAYARWVASGRRGIVQAVTGAGKSRLGLEAVTHIAAGKGRAVVLVPSVALMQQWRALFRQHLPQVSIGMLGDGHKATTAQVTIAVVNSFVRSLTQFSDVALLIADEVHSYGAATFSKALLQCASWRLGLTATLERTDDAVEEVLIPYFGNVVYTCDFSIARKDGRLAPARIALLGVRFNPDEDEAYQTARAQKDSAKRKLVREFGVDDTSIGVFLQEVQRLSNESGQACYFARRYLSARNAETDILANATGKRLVVQHLSHLFQQHHSGLIFCERIAVAEEIAATLCKRGVRVEALTANESTASRDACLQKLRTGRLDAISTGRLLDQGIDIRR
ncbi:MAG: DEAD/DEAH box helicase family protein [Chthoniobacterales bacterium]|nr:DEAD/DEAH box helicase family protein [Chthoniobacterales bacterium]